ncbi:MAG: TolB family protein [Bacteroidota bacterium]
MLRAIEIPACTVRFHGRVAMLLLLVILPVPLFSQGFQLLNGRHEAGVSWQMTRSGPVELVYPERLTPRIPEILATAQESYDTLSEWLNLENPEPVRFYLTDHDEIANGYAVPLSGGHAFIWIGATTYASKFTGKEKWIRKVIWHEMAHLLHGQAVDSPMGRWSYLFSDPMPLVWAEGLAQYLTEEWDTQRGERYLRTAIFDPDRQDWNGGRTGRYARGHSMVRYLAETRGDSTLVRLLHHRTGRGWFERHSFRRAFQDVTEEPWQEFHQEWEQHVSVDYFSTAARSERVDSLGRKPWLRLDAEILDMKWRPDGGAVALLLDERPDQPVRRLVLASPDSLDSPRPIAMGGIRPSISWSPWSDQLVYSRLNRVAGGALEYDLFLYDLELAREIRLTTGRRVRSPVFGPHGVQVAAIVNDDGTDQVVLFDRDGSEQLQLTSATGDSELVDLAWNHERNELYAQRFRPDGVRMLVRIPLTGNGERPLGTGPGDHRRPVVSPDGNRLIFTALEDGVPNLFQVHLDSLGNSEKTHRMTHLFTGGTGLDWIHTGEGRGKVFLAASEQLEEDRIYRVSADRKRSRISPEGLADYQSWRYQRPTFSGEADDSNRSGGMRTVPYPSLSETRHLASVGLPWMTGTDQYGLSAGTVWMEPMMRHLWVAGGAYSIPSPAESAIFLGYLNRTWHPTLWTALYRFPFYAGSYGGYPWIERRTGGTFSARWMGDNPDLPGSDLLFATRFRWEGREPWSWSGQPADLRWEEPEAGEAVSMQLVWMIRSSVMGARLVSDRQSGYGIRLSIHASDRRDREISPATTADLESWVQFPLFSERDQLHLRFRLQSQWGSPFPQDRIGLSRRDRWEIPLPFELSTYLGHGRERVRGHREFVATDRLTFVSAEYRLPILPSLQTTLFGWLRLGRSDLVLFVDGAVSGNRRFRESVETGRQWVGTGMEWLNRFTMGPLEWSHSIGVAQSATRLGGRDVDLYYRLRTRIPF